MIELVETEEALRTPNVRDVVDKLVQVGQTLQAHLDKMDKLAIKGGRFRGFVRQLISGQQDQEVLERILKDLERTKHDLSMHIQLANVGLTRGVDKALLVSVAAVEAVNRQLQAKLGPTHTLRISKLLENRCHNSETHQLPRAYILPQLMFLAGDGAVALTEDDIALLSSPDLAGPDGAHGAGIETTRIIKDNEVSLHALQLNSSIGQFDTWENVATIRIEGNKATSHGIQLNHPMSMSAFVAAVQVMQAMKG